MELVKKFIRRTRTNFALYNFVSGFCSVLDGVVSIVSLGLLTSDFKFQYIKYAAKQEIKRAYK